MWYLLTCVTYMQTSLIDRIKHSECVIIFPNFIKSWKIYECGNFLLLYVVRLQKENFAFLTKFWSEFGALSILQTSFPIYNQSTFIKLNYSASLFPHCTKARIFAFSVHLCYRNHFLFNVTAFWLNRLNMS